MKGILEAMRPRLRHSPRIFCAATASLLVAAPDALAYLDPGTGSIILQGLIAAVVAGLFYVRSAWARIKSFFRRRPVPGPEDKRQSP